MNKKTLKENRLTIIGLLSLAKEANKNLDNIENTLMEITGEEKFGHCGDLCWSEIKDISPEQGYKYLVERAD